MLGGPQGRGVLWGMWGRDGSIVILGTLGGTQSLAGAINNNGQIIGVAANTNPDPNSLFGWATETRGFIWEKGVMRDLGTLGGSDASPSFINERRQVTGVSYVDSTLAPDLCGLDFHFPIVTHPFFWQNGAMVDIGYSFLAGDETYHPFRWRQGKLIDLGTLGGTFGAATQLNEAGDIAGVESLAGNDNVIHATLWSRGQITDLGAFTPDQCSVSLGINSRKQVVGTVALGCDFNDDPSLRAFLWEPSGQMLDINTLISSSLGIQLRNATAINDRGEMTAVAWFADGSHRQVLLVPCNVQRTGEDCQGSTNFNGASRTVLVTDATLAVRRRHSPVPLSNQLRALLRHWHVPTSQP